MAKQSISTEKVASVAEQIRRVNTTINHAFDSMQQHAKALDSAWKSPAGSRAQTKMYEIFKVNAPRSNVLDNYVRMLDQTINPNYNSTEKTNRRLADQFK